MGRIRFFGHCNRLSWYHNFTMLLRVTTRSYTELAFGAPSKTSAYWEPHTLRILISQINLISVQCLQWASFPTL